MLDFNVNVNHFSFSTISQMLCSMCNVFSSDLSHNHLFDATAMVGFNIYIYPLCHYFLTPNSDKKKTLLSAKETSKQLETQENTNENCQITWRKEQNLVPENPGRISLSTLSYRLRAVQLRDPLWLQIQRRFDVSHFLQELI